MRVFKYVPKFSLLEDSSELRDDYNKFVRELKNKLHPLEKARMDIAYKYFNGRGVEIGGFHSPNPLPEGCEADYIDQVSILELKERFSHIQDSYCVYPSIIDNGEILSKVKSDKYDFLIANHMLEHTENFFKTIQAHLRILKEGALLSYAIPDKRFTFDKDRELTTYEHLKSEYYDGSSQSKYDHVYDYKKHVDKLTGDELIRQTDEFMKSGFDTHFHVWTSETFLEHIELAIIDGILNVEIIDHTHKVDFESITILKKI